LQGGQPFAFYIANTTECTGEDPGLAPGTADYLTADHTDSTINATCRSSSTSCTLSGTVPAGSRSTAQWVRHLYRIHPQHQSPTIFFGANRTVSSTIPMATVILVSAWSLHPRSTAILLRSGADLISLFTETVEGATLLHVTISIVFVNNTATKIPDSPHWGTPALVHSTNIRADGSSSPAP